MSVFYLNSDIEEIVFQNAHSNKLPVLLKGPTGCGKSRFVEAMADKLKLPLIQVSCNEDTSASDLLGRFLLRGSETVWQDGPATRAARSGAILYLDEIAEARPDVVVALHSLSDHRRELYLDRTNESIKSHDQFQLVVSFNPGYQGGLKEMKPSTRQRFVTISFTFPTPENESKILMNETGCTQKLAKQLVDLASEIRRLENLVLRETISTRMLVYTAKLIVGGLDPRNSCKVAIVGSLTDDVHTTKILTDLCNLRF